MAHAHSQLPKQPQKLHLADLALEQRWNRMRRSVYGPLDAALAIFVGAFWLGGYPQWRTAVLAALFLGLLGLQGFEARRSCSRSGSSAALIEEVGFALTALSVAVTGGLRSPLLVFLLISIPLLMVLHGWSRVTKRRAGAILAVTVALGLLPDAWVGPSLAGPAFTVAVGVAVAIASMTMAHCMGVLLGAANTSFRDAFRARDEIADHALARARDLEHIGAQLSHELKNPLGAIKALVQLSLRAPAGSDGTERLEVIDSEVQRMQAILQEYLSFSRPLEKLQRQPVSLGGLVDEVFAALEARALGAGIGLRLLGYARVDADPRRIKEALINLVANALEASAPGTTVEVEIAEQAAVVLVEVRDRGRGMSPEVLERVGTPFFTTRDEGTGLGVALARATFGQHGGGLEYLSAPGEGTTACATLPAASERRRD